MVAWKVFLDEWSNFRQSLVSSQSEVVTQNARCLQKSGKQSSSGFLGMVCD